MPDPYTDTPPLPPEIPSLTKAQRATLRRALRLLESQLTQSEVFTSPTAVKQYCQVQIGLERDEHFCCLFLNTRHSLIAFERLFRGTVDGASVYSRVVVRRALELNTSAVNFIHNHPSGIAEPSRDQIGYLQPPTSPLCEQKIQEAGRVGRFLDVSGRSRTDR